jgi:predicted transcriptional regulator
MDSFIGGLWIMFIGFFLYHLADAGYRQISFNNVFGALTVGNIIKRNITVVSVDTDIDDLVNNYFLNFRYSAFPVVSSDNKLAGMVTLNNVKTISKEKRPYVTVLSIMDKNMDKFTVHSKENISSAVNKIIKNKTGRVICVENGYPVGILTKKDIMTILKLKTYLG